MFKACATLFAYLHGKHPKRLVPLLYPQTNPALKGKCIQIFRLLLGTEEGPAVGSTVPYLTSARAEQPPSSVDLSVAICEMRMSPAAHSAAQMWQNLRPGTWHQMDLIE